MLFKFAFYHPVAIATIQTLKIFALHSMEISKRYISVPVRDNCALFALTFLFSGQGYPVMSLKFLPCRLLLLWQQIFGQN